MQTMKSQSSIVRFTSTVWRMRPGVAALVVVFIGCMMMLEATPILTADPNTTNKLIVLLIGFCITIFGMKWWCEDVEKR
jgi:hypothetical protein